MDIQLFVNSTCKELGLAPHRIHILPDPNMNAYVCMSSIVLTKTLVEALTDDELCAVVLHELGHSYHKHLQQRMALEAGHLVLSGINLFLPLPIWKKVLIEVGLQVTQIAVQVPLFHKQEFEADSMSLRYGLNRQLATALRKLEDHNNKRSNYPALMSVIGKLTHPSTDERIKRLNAPIING